jgi:15-cis-phytoene desaturase
MRVILVEKRTEPCGRASSCDDPITGDRMDIGPHVLVSEYPNLLSLLETLGTSQRIRWETDELITLLSAKGRTPMRLSALPAPLHLLPSMLKAPDVSLKDKLSNARVLWLAMRLGEPELLQFDSLPASDLLA